MDVVLSMAGPGDAKRLNAALARLSGEMGDTHSATTATLADAGWGATPAFRALIAEAGDDALAGVALYSPCFSTVRGGAGIYVSDLWTAPEMRGRGLGRRLLAGALRDGAATWGAGFIKLSAYHANVDALRFYEGLGFRPLRDQHDLILDREGAAALGGER